MGARTCSRTNTTPTSASGAARSSPRWTAPTRLPMAMANSAGSKPRDRKRQPADPHRALRDHVGELLRGGHAHLVFKDAIADWPIALRGTKPAGQPFTPWRLLEHIRITQWDIVEFTNSAQHVSPE